MRHDNDSLPLRYIRSVFAPEDAALQSIAASIEQSGKSGMRVSAEEGKLLHWLASLHGAKKIVEVGTLGGYSTLWLARAMGADGHLYTIEKNPEHAAMARANLAQSELAGSITILEADALVALCSIEALGSFDMIFIDADKIRYPMYLDWAEAHVRKGGLIVGDNTFLFGAVYLDAPPEGTTPTTWAAMRDFNQRLGDPQRYTSILIPTEEGMTVAIKNF